MHARKGNCSGAVYSFFTELAFIEIYSVENVYELH